MASQDDRNPKSAKTRSTSKAASAEHLAKLGTGREVASPLTRSRKGATPSISGLSKSRPKHIRTSYAPPNTAGKFPWKWRWIGVPLLVLVGILSGLWAWGSTESSVSQQVLIHLGCEEIDTANMTFDWSYRSVTVDGQLPPGVTPGTVERIILNGSSDTRCLQDRNGNENTGVQNVTIADSLAAPIFARLTATSTSPKSTA